MGVCRSWRSVGFEQFFLSRWATPDASIIHPLQLLALVSVIPHPCIRCICASCMRVYVHLAALDCKASCAPAGNGISATRWQGT